MLVVHSCRHVPPPVPSRILELDLLVVRFFCPPPRILESSLRGCAFSGILFPVTANPTFAVFNVAPNLPCDLPSSFRPLLHQGLENLLLVVFLQLHRTSQHLHFALQRLDGWRLSDGRGKRRRHRQRKRGFELS